MDDLAAHVRTYCTLSTLSAEADAALSGVVASLQGASSGGRTLLQLIESSQEVLTSTDDGVRNRGTMLLAEVLTRHAPALLAGQTPAQVATLLSFFADRLQDEPCVREVLRGARRAVDSVEPGAGPEVAAAVAKLCDGVFTHVHVQSLSLSDRNNAYQLVHAAVVRFALAPAALGDNAVLGFVGIMDGERDPRNLKLCFSVIPPLAAAHLSSTSDAEALFNVFSCYFPITFTPPPNDTVGITSDMLREGLLECLSCHMLVASQALDLAQGKLASADPGQTRLDAMDVIAALASRFTVTRSMGTRGVRQVWSLLRLQIMDSSEAEVQARARSCLRHLLRLAAQEEAAADDEGAGGAQATTRTTAIPDDLVMGTAPALADDLLAGSPREHLMKQIRMQCMVDLKSPEEARARRGASALMCAISAHPRTAAPVLREALQALRDIILAPARGTASAPLPRQLAALEVLLQIVLSARSLWAYMTSNTPAQDLQHPLSANGQEVFECVSGVVQLPGDEGSTESAAVRLAALDVVVELVTDDRVLAQEMEVKVAELACMTLAAARTAEAAQRCAEAVAKLAQAWAGGSREVVVGECVVPRLLQALSAAAVSDADAEARQHAELQLAKASELLARLAALSAATTARALPRMLAALERGKYVRAWRVCAADERVSSGKAGVLAVLGALTGMAPARAAELAGEAMAAVLDPIVEASAAERGGAEGPCAETMCAVGGFVGAVLQGLPGDGREHRELASRVFGKVVPSAWAGAAQRGLGSVGSGGEAKELLGVLCAAVQACHPSALEGVVGGGGCAGAEATSMVGDGGCVSGLDVAFGLWDLSAAACREGGAWRSDGALAGDEAVYVRGLVCAVNKLGDEDVDRFVSAMFAGALRPLLAAGGEAQAGVAAVVGGAVVAGLFARGCKRAMEGVDFFFALLGRCEGEVALAGAGAYEVLTRASSGLGLNKDGHARVKKLWRQRLLSSELPRLSEGYTSAPPAQKGVYLQALTYVLRGAPAEAVVMDLPRVLPLLVQALACPETPSKVAALALLLSFLAPTATAGASAAAPAPGPGEAGSVAAAGKLLEGHVSTLVPSLLAAAKFPGSLKVRCLSVECLAVLPSHVPFHKVYPLRAQVTRELGSRLADHKRCVRQRAATCRNIWYMLTS